MRIVQLVNLVTARSGGIRTAVDRLGRGYAAAGHERHVILPGTRRDCRAIPGGVAWTLPGRRVPASGGYRVLVGRRSVRQLLNRLAPDVVEVSDRWTLTWVGPWARARDVRSVALVHEHLAQTMAAWPGVGDDLAARLAERADRRLVERFDAVVCASRHSAGPFGGAAIVVPLGVDLSTFRPRPAARDHRHAIRLVVVGRLSAEKRPDLALATIATLRDQGVDAHLTLIGDGQLRASLETDAADLPVDLVGHVVNRDRLAELVAAADVALAPCPIETFGLAALEALACGTPVVATGGGTRDLLEGRPPAAGRVVAPAADQLATAVADLGRLPREVTRQAARRVAEQYPWSKTVAGLLSTHGGRQRAAMTST